MVDRLATSRGRWVNFFVYFHARVVRKRVEGEGKGRLTWSRQS